MRSISSPTHATHHTYGTNKQHALVKPVQQYLKDIGLYKGTVHGFFDPAFAESVKVYQEKYVKLTGKNVDGIITAGKMTWKKLLGL